MYKCHNDGGNQEFVLTGTEKEFRHQDLCIGISRRSPEGQPVTFNSCHGWPNQKWAYVGQTLKPEGHNLCLDSKYHDTKGLTIEKCNHSRSQNFRFEMRNIPK